MQNSILLNINVLQLMYSSYSNDIKMNNEEQDVKKSIMMIVGACIFLVAAAQALPLFFGVGA